MFTWTKTITVDNSQVALQMWDTAGQERYRSITKQFFRKADGVIVMYDITAEQNIGFSLLLPEIPIMLLGNKMDKEAEREVQKEVGERLAKDCQMTFFECSACSGDNVAESMVQLTQKVLQKSAEGERHCDVEDGVDVMMSDIYRRSSPILQQQSEEGLEERPVPSSPRGQPVGKETSINVSITAGEPHLTDCCYSL
uniref:Small monomeric GTPase n=1 Tax=Fundulus heteroclitus TaxID=8078 RepID=A0A3Q2NZ57_FUNHE